jgi:cytochrome b subunit of formate dehydrogenase
MRLRRNGRRARWLHAAAYLTTFALLATGWWLFAGREGDPSPLARVFSLPDVSLHEYAGWALAAIAVLTVVVAPRATARFARDSMEFRARDLEWYAEWPRAAFTGRFGRHEGHFDPGQRVANIIMVGGLLTLVITGLGLVMTSTGTAYVWFLHVHRWATFVVTPVIAGHVVVGAGLLPGYRGVWRAVHSRDGAVAEEVARRLWPGWTDRRGHGHDVHDPAASPTKGL